MSTTQARIILRYCPIAIASFQIAVGPCGRSTNPGKLVVPLHQADHVSVPGDLFAVHV
jgi:hypothetical protein